MALTKIPRGLLDTGIADSSDATAITIDSSENVTFAGNILKTGDLTLDVSGNIKLDADGGNVYFDDATTSYGLIFKDSTGLAIRSVISDGDFKIQGNDGGSTINALTFDMSEAGAATFNGEVLIPEKLTHAGDTDTHFKFAGANDIRIVAGNVEHAAFDVNTIVFNQSGADMDFRVESTGNASMLHVDAGNNRVGIGTNAPWRTAAIYASSQAELGFKTGSVSSGALIYYNDSEDKFLIRAQESGDHIAFQIDGATERMRIDSSGRVGIGTTPAYGLLDVRQTGTGAQDRGLFVDVTPASSGSNNNAAYINVGNGNMTNTVFRIHHESPAANQKLLSLDTTGSNTEKFWVDEDGDAYLAGFLEFPDGSGIHFGASQGSGSASEKLDDYEEGTWTPGIGSNGTVTHGGAKYTKIGNLVTVTANLYGFTDRSATSAIAVNGLPFAQTGSGSGVGGLIGRHMDKVVSPYVNGVSGNTTVNFYTCDSGGYTAIKHSELNASGADFHFTISYRV